MERQGARKGLGRPHRPALDHDAASLRGHAGGMGAKPGRRSADRSGEIAEKRPEITQSAQILAGSDFLAEAGLAGSDLPESDLAGPDLPSQIDFSDRHSSDVSN